MASVLMLLRLFIGILQTRVRDRTTTLKVMGAWSAANNVYRTLDGLNQVRQAFENDGKSRLRDQFDFSNIRLLSSKTGAFIKVKSGFAVIAPGKNINNKNELLVAIRGTDLAADWLTDANCGLQVSSTGKMVHAGFNRVFAELRPHLVSYFARTNPTLVHCVGHSLGGALASMTADMIVNKGIAKAKLYTFGCPRVGFQPFANRLTQTIGEDNMYRVHHDNDFVSLVPLWPFVHTRQPGTSCCLENAGFGTFGAHKIDNYQITLMPYANRADAWDALRTKSVPITGTREIKKWLSMETVSIISGRTLALLSQAVQHILAGAGIGAMLVGIAGISFLDRLSYAVELAWKGSKEMAGWVELLVRKLLKITGQAIVIKTTFTAAFIRWVFQLLSNAVNRMVNLSLIGSRE